MSSPEPTKADNMVKNSSGSTDGERKSYIPIATSTPVPVKSGNSAAVSPTPQSGANKTKGQGPPRLSQQHKKSSAPKNVRSDETLNLSTKEKQKANTENNGGGLPSKTEGPAQEKSAQSTEIKALNGPSNSFQGESTLTIENVPTDANGTISDNTDQTITVVVGKEDEQGKEEMTLCNGDGVEEQIGNNDSPPSSQARSVVPTVDSRSDCNGSPDDGTPDSLESKTLSAGSTDVSPVDRTSPDRIELSPISNISPPECKPSSSERRSSFSETKPSLLAVKPSSLEINRQSSSSKPPSCEAIRQSSVIKSPIPEGKPLSPSIPVRRRLSYIPASKHNTLPNTGRRASEVTPSSRGCVTFDELKRGNNSVDSLKMLNRDLRDQLSKLRCQFENQRGSIRQSQWQKIVDIRHIRQEEQQRLNLALGDQFQKLEKEKQRDLDNQREQLNQKFESDLQKASRFKDADISKLKQELSSKDAMLQRLLGESRHARIKMDIDDRKLKLIDELKELRQAKRELKSSLDNASVAERAFSNNLRKTSESFESEIARAKKEAQTEVRQLIEQLKNKDKLISQLEKDLGRQSWGAAAHFAVLERRRSEGNPLPPGGLDLSPPFRTLPEGSDDPDAFPWTPTSIQTPGDVEDVWSNNLEGNPHGKRDLPNQLKGTKDRNRELVEKCRSFLQQNKELTAQNRAFKESNERATQDAKKLQELLEHSKLQILQQGRQLSQLKAERDEWEEQVGGVEGLRQEVMEDKKMINALRKACSDKDRRIELIQHRKKRRRMLESAEKAKIQSAGLKETPFGYEEDDKQQGDGNQSVCSLSSTISDDSVWDEVFSKEEMERNYQRLMLEQLELQKSHAMLQRQTDDLQDPQRENLTKTDLQNDLFLAQCRIEQLEHFINEGLQGQTDCIWEERDRIQAQNKNLHAMVKNMEKENNRLRKELANVQERNEDMEFRLIELEQFGEHVNGKEVPCPDTNPNPPATSDRDVNPKPSSSSLAQTTDSAIEDLTHVDETGHMMEQFAKELNGLLKGRGRDADAALKKMATFIDQEKALHGMANELQMKVINLQKEKNSLQDKLLLVEQSQPGKGGNSASLAAARERQENLALKAAIESQSLLVSERNNLQDELEDLKAKNDVLKHQIDILTLQQHQQCNIKEEEIQACKTSSLQSSIGSNHSKGNSTSGNSLIRKSSDRKSKCRDVEDPTLSKRRKNTSEHEFDLGIEPAVKKCQALGDVTPLNDSKALQIIVCNDQIGTMAGNQNKLHYLEKELSQIKKCNDELMVQLQETITKKLEVESCQQTLQDKISAMERDLDLLHKENVALGDQLRQRVEEFQFSQDERSPRVSELEEFCEDLQDRLRDAENSERQLREKLKLFEKSVEEAESQEMMMRERCEQLLTGDFEAKKQIQALQRTELELRDIVIEREIVEQALRDKVDFLQKAEAASVQRIDELEGIVEDLSQQLEEKSDGRSQSQKEAHKITELKHQMTFLETDNKALSARVAELEENEETLRENWRRVADEDFNRTQCLEEKVKMLEGMNRDLKLKLKDSQEYFVINMSDQNLSLAAELAESESKIFDDSSDDDDEVMGGGNDTDSPSKQSSTDSEKKVREKVRKLERQLSEVAEQKNTKIESLQEQLVGFKETEIKLSETIAEMEMTERELRAKLALYESSEVTVEKMLKYQSKIEELRTSQESLLDQLEIKENEEMTLQEQMQEMERTLRGKIVTLEGEMKGYKQKELKNAGQIRELEKQENELSEKLAQQAEKENGLYVKISSLMDDLKSSNTELENVKRQMEDKEDKVRQAKLLEVKLLEIEMECGKKVSVLNAKLRHREEEFRQKESAYVEEISTLHEIQDSKSQLEEVFAQREQDLQKIENEKENAIVHLSSQISELQKSSAEVTSKMCSLENELESERQKVFEKESLIQSLNEEIESKSKYFESLIAEKETEHGNEMESFEFEIQMKEEKMMELEKGLKESLEQIRNLEREKKSSQKAAQDKIVELKSFCDNCISEIEKKAGLKLSSLVTKMENMQSHISHLQPYISEQKSKIHKLETEKEEQTKIFAEKSLKLREERESEQSSLVKDSQEREASLRFDISNLQHQVEQHKRELIAKLSELEAKNKANCELSLQLSNIRHDHKSLQKELDKSKQSHSDLKISLESVISQRDDQLEKTSKDILQLKETVQRVTKEAKDKDQIIDQISSDKDALIKEKSEESQRLTEERSHIENEFSEKCQELNRVNELHRVTKTELVETRKMLDDKDQAIQKHEQEKGEKEVLLKETQYHVQSAQVHKDNLTQELQTVKSQLEEAQTQIITHQQQLELLQTQLQSHQEEVKDSNIMNKEKEDTIKEKDHIVTTQQQELHQLKYQLQTQQEEINDSKILIKEKEEKLQEKDQKYEQLSTELKEMHQHLQDQDQELKQAESKVADVELKLNKAENRVRELESMQASLEMRLEERYAVSQNAEKVLLSKEMQFNELENKLEVTEKNLVNLKDQISLGDESTKELSHQLQNKEKEVEEQQNEISVLKENLKEKDEKQFSVESKLKQMETDFKTVENNYTEGKEKVDKLTSELKLTEKALEEKEKSCNHSEIQITNLEADNSDLKSKCDSLLSELDHMRNEVDQKNCDLDELLKQTKERDSELSHCKAELSKTCQELSIHLSKLEETDKIHSQKSVEVENVNKENVTLKEKIDQLSSEKEKGEEQLRHEIKNEGERSKNHVLQLESEKSNLVSVVEFLEKENTDLKNRIESTENKLDVVNEQRCELTQKKEDVSKQLSEAQNETKQLLIKIGSLESDRNQLETENIQLQKEIDEAAKEFQNLTLSFEESKTNIENKVQEISEGKQKVEEDFEALQKKHSSQTSEMIKQLEGKDSEIEAFEKKCDILVQENTMLLSNVDSLKVELSQSQDMSKAGKVESVVEDQMVCETVKKVSMAPPLFQGLDTNPQTFGSDGSVDEQNSEQKLTDLETSLNEIKEKEKTSEKRIYELETIEKELREQIVDIEMTVIVPLETENQDLKDEIGMVKQERDEAIAKISRWDDDDEDSESRIQESEKVHQQLEDALILMEELEKKNTILSDDIHKLENENETMLEKIADLESIEMEKKDEIENLHEEMKRLQEMDQDASVLEETETTLMDRVLDLEERERNLIQELEQLKEKSKDVTGPEDISEKMKYLEQKNQILEDAEGRYMDKIMELEEDKHRLLSELSSLSDNVNTHSSLPHHIPHTSCVNNDSVSISTQTSVPLESDTVVVGATNSSDSVDSSYHSDTLFSSEQTQSSSTDGDSNISLLENQLKDNKVKLEELESQIREKDTVMLYLQDKLELLQDSEGKLMDKLLEAEEKASNAMHSKYSTEIAELNKKIEQIQEENEFLAENVEQYKKSFKEEKEKCNDLQDRLLEDSSNVAELQRTQDELVKTQQMVEDIQSEYEDELSKVLEQENELKEELSKAVKKQSDLEEILIVKTKDLTKAVEKQSDLEEMVTVKTKSEKELKEQVESLKSLEKELRSKIVTTKVEEEDSAMSDSGLSADDPRMRNETEVVEAPVVHRSVKTVLLAKPPTSSNKPSPNAESSDPVTLPRSKRKHRWSSIENISHEELIFLVEDLQDREAALKKRVSDLQDIDHSDLSQRVSDLEFEKLELERRLRDAEQQKVLSHNLSSYSSKSSRLGLFGDSPNNGNNQGVSGDSHLDRSFTSTPVAMLEKPEDVLIQKIKELEGLDKHNKNTVSELERDREVLHEIARKDKATIHDLNVKIRELQLSERSLKEQVTNLEVSENSFFTKCEELEAVRLQLEDRVHELEIHERRLRELVRKLKLDEERWLSKSDGMENAVAELSANEVQLKRILQDIEMEKGGLSERAEYLEARIRELESVEVSLLARVKDYENNEVTLQNRLVQLENAEAASHSRASELDMMNVNLAQQHKKMMDENAVMSQHLAQLHGQVQDLDRRLLSSRDSEIAYKQHVESLQKNESMLQKKVREFELREIDSQSAIRELEQNAEICNDKLSALQRSENRLRYRVQELEGVGGQIPGELTPSQQQKVPQNIEDCQKRIVVLQGQVENLKLQLRQALNTTQQQSANKLDADEEEGKTNTVSIATEEYSELHAKAALLDEYAYQNGELESNQEQLRDTILQLRQGKGACGHEVEIEVYKRRNESLQAFISKLKLSLSEGQTTSLLDPDQESGPQGETLPARHLQVLESERVLQSVRGLHSDGKADTPTTTNGGVQPTGLAQVEDSMVQSQAVKNMAALPPSTTHEENKGGQKGVQTGHLEESHWKAIEARKPVTKPTAADSRGGVSSSNGRETKPVSSSPRHYGKQLNSTTELEEVTGFLNLQSESEHSSYHIPTHNDTDSCSSPVPPPRKNRANRLSKNLSDDNSSNNGSGSDRDHHQNPASKATANQRHFGEESLPLTASNIEKQLSSQQRTPVPLSRFAEDSFYLPSSTQEGIDSLEDDDESPPPLPSQGPPGQEMALSSGCSSRASSTNILDGRGESLDNSTSGLSIRERIAMIERHLQSDVHTGSQSNREEEDQLFYWKRKSTENLRQAEVLDKNNKFLKEDINRLEKELEEKRRYINTLELWLSSTEDLLKNKSKQTDREMVEQLQLDLSKLRRELQQSGYRSEDAMLDPAALRTELEHKDRDISAKRVEIDGLAQELKRCHRECRSIEGMRRTALDSLRALEKEVLHLQESDEKLKKVQSQLNSLKVQYENKRMDLNTIISEKDELEFGMSKLILERDSFKIDLKKAEQDKDVLKNQVEELTINVEDLSVAAGKSSKLEEELKNLNDLLVQRNEKIREVYEENLNLRDGVNKSEAELIRFRTLCDDFNNLSARYDELDQFKNQALALVQPLQMKVDRLSKKCRDKDILLRKLGAELRQGHHRPSSVLDELTRLERAMNGEEYNTDNSDNMSDDLSPRPPNYKLRGRSVSMDELSFHSDTDSVHMPAGPSHTAPKRQRPTPYVNSRPRSAEAGNATLRSPRRSQTSPRVNQPGHRPSSHYIARGFDLAHEHFVVIADYDPGLYSQSGRPRLELSLREGDHVRVSGPMDRLGYCEAECNGRTGLVPANYLQPVHFGEMNGHGGPNPVIHLEHGGVAPPLEFQDHSPRQSHGNNSSMPMKPSPRSYEEGRSRPVPDPPTNLHVRGMQDGCLILAWKPPQMDSQGCNKGFQVMGYMVYVDNQEYEQIPNPQFCQVAIERFDPSTSHLLAVQSLCAGGHVSPRTELMFEGMVRIGESPREEDGQGPLDTDLSSVLNSVHYSKGIKKKVMALYEYNPEHQSPHDYTAFELTFHAGDIISVYGEPRPDGFYHGEMEGKRGLVPACFVEDLATTLRLRKNGSEDSGHESSKA